ncbi:MAG: hypothetical protein AMS26_22565 [Bacteroides sp. SM23_62]|nr:MAG: hypothetical protein AMS26_22565 [Bacteroides sp. SM23_62]
MRTQYINNNSLADGLHPGILNIHLYAPAPDTVIAQVSNKDTTENRDYAQHNIEACHLRKNKKGYQHNGNICNQWCNGYFQAFPFIMPEGF